MGTAEPTLPCVLVGKVRGFLMTLSHGPVLSIAVSLCILLMSRPTQAEGERERHRQRD